jgi:hypothetical protein
MPAPIPPGAALPVIELDLITARPLLAMPAPAGMSPPSVAELCATVEAFRVRLDPMNRLVALFIVAPVVGGVLAARLHRLLYREEGIRLAAEA